MAAVKKLKTGPKGKPVTKKSQAPVEIKPVAKVIPITDAPTPRPRPASDAVSNLAKKVMAMQQQKAPQKVDGFGKPQEQVRVAEYLIKLEDGTVLCAEGKHADVIARFVEECQNICIGQGLAYYGGPPLTRYSAEQWEARG